MGMETAKHSMLVVDKPQSAPRTPAAVYGSASSDRPYVCPYDRCEKAYIHEYKLNLHLKKEHPGHNSEENKHPTPVVDGDMDESSEQDTLMKKISALKSSKKNKPSPVQQMPPSKVPKHKGPSFTSTNVTKVKKPWPIKDMHSGDSVEIKRPWPIKDADEEDSEETEEDEDDGENDDDDEDEETEDEG